MNKLKEEGDAEADEDETNRKHIMSLFSKEKAALSASTKPTKANASTLASILRKVKSSNELKQEI